MNNIGCIERKISLQSIKKLNEYIKEKKETITTFPGNITCSYYLEDKNNWFFKKEIIPTIEQYIKTFGKEIIPLILTKNCKYKLHHFWVNYQKKYEFNPIHHHNGVFSFIVWLEIPSSYKKESKLPFLKNSSEKLANCFQFLYPSGQGSIEKITYKLEPSHNGTMLLFPSKLDHCVYPFYLSNKKRISISGNVYLNPKETYDF